jgi:hypothetical protein
LERLSSIVIASEGIKSWPATVPNGLLLLGTTQSSGIKEDRMLPFAHASIAGPNTKPAFPKPRQGDELKLSH